MTKKSITSVPQYNVVQFFTSGCLLEVEKIVLFTDEVFCYYPEEVEQIPENSLFILTSTVSFLLGNHETIGSEEIKKAGRFNFKNDEIKVLSSDSKEVSDFLENSPIGKILVGN